MQKLLILMLSAAFLVTPVFADAETVHSRVGAQGYDLVSYHTSARPLQGNGNNTVTYEGVNYLFINKEHAETFKKNPSKYLPAYGGWCAFGVSVGKKFIGDPTVWEIVDNQLYFNLDNRIKGMWIQDISGNIKKAENQWPKIKNKNPADL